MQRGSRDSAQEAAYKAALHGIEAKADVKRRAAETMAASASRGFVLNQPKALQGFGITYEGAAPSAPRAGKRRRSSGSLSLEGGTIDAALGNKLLQARIAHLDAAKEQQATEAAASVGAPPPPPRLSTAPTAAGAAVAKQVEAALASLQVGLQSGLYSASALIDPCKEALASLLAGASELSLPEIDSLLKDVSTLKDVLDTDLDGDLSGKVAEVGKASYLVLEACEATLEQSKQEAERGDSTEARRAALKVNSRQLSKDRLAELQSVKAQQGIRAAARAAAARRAGIAAAAAAARDRAGEGEGEEEGADAEDEEDGEGEDGEGGVDAPTAEEAFTAALEAATTKAEAVDALRAYDATFGVETTYVPRAATSLSSVKRYVKSLAAMHRA